MSKFNKYFKGNPVIWTVIIILSMISMLAVYSSTGTLAYKYHGGNTFYYFLKHTLFLVIGIVITYFIHFVPYKFFSRISFLLLLITIPLLLITMMLGTSLNEASRWITLPVLGLTFQTSDLAKLALILYLANVLSKKQKNIKDFKESFVPIMIPVLLVCGLILKADFSTAGLLFATSLLLMFVGRISLKHITGLVLLGVIFVSIFIVIGLYTGNTGRIGTWKNRIVRYTDSENTDNYQVEQSKIAIVTGGLLGKGPGNSTQRNFLPHPYSDFIYAIIIEEYGMVGGIFILFLYMFLLYQVVAIVKQCKKTFPALLVTGLMLSLSIQALINMLVALDFFPVTGQTLPLLSMGGTSILFTSIAFGIILSVSRTINEEKEKELLAQQIESENIENFEQTVENNY